MSKLEVTLTELRRLESRDGAGLLGNINAGAKFIVTIVYLILILRIPLDEPVRLLWFFIYPIAFATASDISYTSVFRRSLWILPFVILIGIFNPLLQRSTEFVIYGIPVSEGWVSFTVIIMRGLLAMQAVIILMENTGFFSLCNALHRMKMPLVLTTQLMLVYRYISVLTEECISMDRARKARGYGNKAYSLRLWSSFVGQLLLRSVDRAERINKAMLARGFNGTMPEKKTVRWKLRDTLFTIITTGILAALYYFKLENLFY